MVRRWVHAAFLGLALLLALVGPAVGAPGNQLTNGTVSPATGTTANSFAFTVHYTSAQGHAATQVIATVASFTVPMRLIGGNAADGTFRGVTNLPAGSWQVTFLADAEKGFDPSLIGPTVTVTLAPPPTPVPTPVPTPKPTPKPTPAPPPPPPPKATPAPPPPAAATPLPATPVPSAATGGPASAGGSPGESPRSGLIGGVVGSPGATTGPDGAPAVGRQNVESQLWTILMGGLIGVAALTLIGIFLILREGRRNVADERIALLKESPPPTPPTPRPRRDWEDYELDNLPLGTVEYEPPERRH